MSSPPRTRFAPSPTGRLHLGNIRTALFNYLFAGDQDPVGDNGKGMKSLYDAYKRAAIFDVRLKLYPGARHETLNETNRQEVTNDFIAWCDEIIAARD